MMTVSSLASQSARAGTAVAAPPTVVVLDQDGQPLAGASVTFAVTVGGGAVAGSPATTDATGTARVASWTLGPVGGLNSVHASAGSTSADFQATALAVTALEVASAQSQQATVGTAVASPPAVRVTDQTGQPLAGVSVRFDVAAGGGTVAQPAATTDAAGVASAGAWTLGTVVGLNTLTAAVGGLSSSFSATTTAGPAARIVYVSGSQQTATVHTTLPSPFIARVTDLYGNVVKGAAVTLAVTAGQDVGARLAATSAVSGDDGTVQALLTLGDSAGPNEASMSVAELQGSPVVFTASADWRRLRATSVSGAYQHACAQGLDGAAYCWGGNAYGELGDGTTDNRSIAIRVGADVGLVGAVAGVWSSCGLNAAGKAYCWGANSDGELGDGSFTEHHLPVAVAGGLTFRQIGVAFTFACGLTTGDAAYCWGANSNGQVGNASPQTYVPAPAAVQGGLRFRSLSLGFDHVCGLSTSGSIYCWGTNYYGEVGAGDTTLRHDLPTAIVSQGKTFIAVSAAQYNACALDQDGNAYCWGLNQVGELGVPATTTPQSAVPIAVPGGLHFTDIFGSRGRYCGTVAGGQVHCWGFIQGTIGPSTINNPPTLVPALGGLTPIVGDNWICGIRAHRDAVCVGQNDRGELGDGVPGLHLRSTPVQVRAP